MSLLRSIGTIVLTAALLVGVVLIAPLSEPVSAGTPHTVPEAIEVPAPYVLLFKRPATGMQTYACQNGQWAFHAPVASLYEPQLQQLTGSHYGGINRSLPSGPWWESLLDGSRIRAGNPQSAPSPNPNSIPLLQLEVLERQGSGEFTPVSYIQRLNTHGGIGPTGACSAGAQHWVPYTADYYFYGNP